jgi:hypothetical protein
MSSSGYTPQSFFAGEVPTTTIWNFLWTNDASFNSGDGFNDGIILTRHLASHAVSRVTTIFDEVAASNPAQMIGQTWTDVTNWTGGSITTNGGDLVLHVEFTYWRQTSGTLSDFRVVIDTTNYPSNNGFKQYTNEFNSHKMCSRTIYIGGLASGVHSVKVQSQAETSGTTNFDNNDYLRITAVELKG